MDMFRDFGVICLFRINKLRGQTLDGGVKNCDKKLCTRFSLSVIFVKRVAKGKIKVAKESLKHFHKRVAKNYRGMNNEFHKKDVRFF